MNDFRNPDHYRPFSNRLKKNKRRLKPNSLEIHSDALRLYDSDIPEFPLTVDRYGEHIVVNFFVKKAVEYENAWDEWVMYIMDIIQEKFPKSTIFKKERRKIRGRKNQYQVDEDIDPFYQTVTEHDVTIETELAQRLDTGLYIDHRPMRSYVQQMARDKHVLNLFCYTGAFSAHAAVGGAASVDSLDLNAHYLKVLEKNYAINSIDYKNKRFKQIQHDCTEVPYPVEKGKLYDIIILDPPTFSNSKRMKSDFWDVQQHHAGLIDELMQLLSPKGVMIFSTNYRKFEMNGDLQLLYTIEDKTKESLPIDAPNTKRWCFFITHRS